MTHFLHTFIILCMEVLSNSVVRLVRVVPFQSKNEPKRSVGTVLQRLT